MDAHLVDVRAPSGALSGGIIALRVASSPAAPHVPHGAPRSASTTPRTRPETHAERIRTAQRDPAPPYRGTRVAVESLSLPSRPRAPPTVASGLFVRSVAISPRRFAARARTPARLRASKRTTRRRTADSPGSCPPAGGSPDPASLLATPPPGRLPLTLLPSVLRWSGPLTNS